MSTPAFTLDDDNQLSLIASAPEHNIHRRWSIAWTPDLFGYWLIETRWGRIGTRGRTRLVAHRDRLAAAREAAQLLRRRAGAETRIGICYKVVG